MACLCEAIGFDGSAGRGWVGRVRTPWRAEALMAMRELIDGKGRIPEGLSELLLWNAEIAVDWHHRL
jgi:hypothetical protein